MTNKELQERCADIRRLLTGQRDVADMLCEELEAAFLLENEAAK